MTGTDVTPFITASLIDSFPDPQELRRAVRTRIEQAYAEAVTERGEVQQAEDTFALQRRLQLTYEQCDHYARGFKDAGALIRQLQQEQLLDAVGEQDGVPLSGLTIPTAGGDIQVTPQFERKNIIDEEQVRAVLAAQTTRNLLGYLRELAEDGTSPEARELEVATLIDEAFGYLLACGAFEPQVTKVKARAAEFARAGDDAMAAVLNGTISVKRTYRDRVKVERKTPRAAK